MPGVIASVAVTVGQKVTAGDMLLTIEAMKMETAIHADRDGVIAQIHAPASSQVDAKDLLIEFGCSDQARPLERGGPHSQFPSSGK